MTTPTVTDLSRVRVAFAGSSSVAPGSPLPAALAAELGLGADDWIALGRRSARLRDWTRPVWPVWPAGLRADAIVVLLTGNDSHPSADEVTEVDRALRGRAPVVVWLPPLPYPAGSSVAGRDRRMRAALAEARVARVTTTVVLEAAHWGRDQAHLTAAGYRAYARQVRSALRQALDARAAPPPTAPPSPATPPPPPALPPTPRPEMTPPPSPAVPSLPGPSGSIGTLITVRGTRLSLTSTDALWMARALAGEGGGEADAYAVTSTMLRRWAMLWDGGTRSFGSLTDLVVGRFRGASPYEGDTGEVVLRGYSQPVAVQWRTKTGDRAERRRRIRSLAWDAIEPWRRQAVLRLFTGRAALTAPGAVHFAERSLVESRLRTNPGWQIVPVPGGANVFVSVSGSRGREPRVIGADQAAARTPLEALRAAVDRGVRSPVPALAVGATVAAVAAIALLARGLAPAPSPAA